MKEVRQLDFGFLISHGVPWYLYKLILFAKKSGWNGVEIKKCGGGECFWTVFLFVAIFRLLSTANIGVLRSPN